MTAFAADFPLERCQFGSNRDLRGYPVGRYYDDALYALQLEYRAPLWKRLGAVVFAGVGSVASSLDRLDSAKSLSSTGVGLRYLASPAQRLNVVLISRSVATSRRCTSISEKHSSSRRCRDTQLVVIPRPASISLEWRKI